MQQPRTITSKQLTLFFIVLILGPVGCGLLLFYFTRKMPEPALEALVRIETMWIAPPEKEESQRLVPCITIKNPTESGWKNLSIELNEQFFSSEPKGIPAGQTLSIPLEAFVARNGSVRFPVGDRVIKLVTVFAQIPSGARGVSEFTIPAKTIAKPNVDGIKTRSSQDDSWISRDELKKG
jgi:hypothetical protein